VRRGFDAAEGKHCEASSAGGWSQVFRRRRLDLRGRDQQGLQLRGKLAILRGRRFVEAR